MRYLFYRLDSNSKDQKKNTLLDEKFSVFIWKPRAFEIVPKGVSLLPFGIWWTMHYLHIFTNQDYSLYLIYDSDNLVHRSVITPRYFRFPFMATDDLQIGDTWTHPSYRGKGLATYAIRQILKHFSRPSRKFWYIVEQNNLSSIHPIEKTDFIKIGEGNRIKRFGLSILGAYNIQKYYVDVSQTI